MIEIEHSNQTVGRRTDLGTHLPISLEEAIISDADRNNPGLRDLFPEMFQG